MQHLVSPSLLSADFACLDQAISMVNTSDADWFHLDVMDGCFVPNITFGPPVVKAIKRLAKKPLDVHLMIVEPSKWIDAFAEAGADYLTVHYEADNHIHRTVTAIRAAGMKAGVALNPHTPVHQLESIIKELDLVLIMSVNPGFGGQYFIPHTYEKIAQLTSLIQRTGSKALIEVDGGVNFQNAETLVKAGVNALVAGNTVFSAENRKQAITKLKYFI